MRLKRTRYRYLLLYLLVTLIGIAVIYGLIGAQRSTRSDLRISGMPTTTMNTVAFHSRFPPTVSDLGVNRQSFCDGRMVAFRRQFALLRNAVVNRRHCRSERRGGEAINTVINQSESIEYYHFDRGCFQLVCDSVDKLDYAFVPSDNHLNAWIRSVQLSYDADVAADMNTEPRFTIALTRYEYANLYHTMTDWYNAFLLLCFFNKTSSATDILFIDSHPSGALDSVWQRLFRRTLRLSDLSLEQPTSFDRLAWGWIGYNSLMTIHLNSPTPPLIEEFRGFFLSAYGLPAAAAIPGRPDCDGMRLSVLFIWRRDYVAHPRNPTGSITRKITNEDKLLQQVRSQLPQARVTGIQIDLFTMDEQLRIIVDTDILIGMHGAGLTHAMFLRSTTALIELLPSYWGTADHFAAIATWRKLVYLRWVNRDPTAESADRRSTVVPPSVITSLIHTAIRRLCPSSSFRPDAGAAVPPASMRT